MPPGTRIHAPARTRASFRWCHRSPNFCSALASAQVVGRTGFCIHPRDAVRDVPKVGGTKDVKLDALRALNPTHVIVNVDENDLSTFQKIQEFAPHVIVTHPNAPEDNIALYRLLGEIFDVHARAEQLTAELQHELVHAVRLHGRVNACST